MGDVARDHQLAAFAERDEVHRVGARFAAHRPHRQRLVKISGFEVGDEFGLPDHVGQRAAEVALGIQAELALGGGVQPFDRVLPAEDDHTVRHGLGRVEEALQVLGQLLARLHGDPGAAAQRGKRPAPDSRGRGHRRADRGPRPADQPDEMAQMVRADPQQSAAEQRPAPVRAGCRGNGERQRSQCRHRQGGADPEAGQEGVCDWRTMGDYRTAAAPAGCSAERR